VGVRPIGSDQGGIRKIADANPYLEALREPGVEGGLGDKGGSRKAPASVVRPLMETSPSEKVAVGDQRVELSCTFPTFEGELAGV
jgi:hypothetical protein